MLVSGLGQASSAVGSLVAIRVFRVQALECQEQVTWPFYMKNMAVVGAATAASLSFGNAGYLFLTVSFVQILKAFTPVVVVLMLYLTAVEIPSKRVTFSVLMIAAGTARHVTRAPSACCLLLLLLAVSCLCDHHVTAVGYRPLPRRERSTST